MYSGLDYQPVWDRVKCPDCRGQMEQLAGQQKFSSGPSARHKQSDMSIYEQDVRKACRAPRH